MPAQGEQQAVHLDSSILDQFRDLLHHPDLADALSGDEFLLLDFLIDQPEVDILTAASEMEGVGLIVGNPRDLASSLLTKIEEYLSPMRAAVMEAEVEATDVLLARETSGPWQERALCSQTDPEAFFPEKGGSTREAKRICVRCEVRAECLEYAVLNQERFGIWGGLSERERRRLEPGERIDDTDTGAESSAA